MTSPGRIVRIFCVLLLFWPYHGVAEDHQKTFNTLELQQFCHDIPIILDSMAPDEKDSLFKSIIMDYSHAVVPAAIAGDSRLSLPSQRITYILFHIMLAGIIEDMGGFGEGRLEFMRKEREKVKNNKTLPPNEKNLLLAELAAHIDHLQGLIVQAKAIPRSELVLLWQEKETLNTLLRGKIPMQRKQMARQ